jgi:hypothetical protein
MSLIDKNVNYILKPVDLNFLDFDFGLVALLTELPGVQKKVPNFRRLLLVRQAWRVAP